MGDGDAQAFVRSVAGDPDLLLPQSRSSRLGGPGAGEEPRRAAARHRPPAPHRLDQAAPAGGQPGDGPVGGSARRAGLRSDEPGGAERDHGPDRPDRRRGDPGARDLRRCLTDGRAVRGGVAGPRCLLAAGRRQLRRGRRARHRGALHPRGPPRPAAPHPAPAAMGRGGEAARPAGGPRHAPRRQPDRPGGDPLLRPVDPGRDSRGFQSLPVPGGPEPGPGRAGAREDARARGRGRGAAPGGDRLARQRGALCPGRPGGQRRIVGLGPAAQRALSLSALEGDARVRRGRAERQPARVVRARAPRRSLQAPGGAGGARGLLRLALQKREPHAAPGRHLPLDAHPGDRPVRRRRAGHAHRRSRDRHTGAQESGGPAPPRRARRSSPAACRRRSKPS